MWDTLFPKLWLIQPTHAWFNQLENALSYILGFFTISLWLLISHFHCQQDLHQNEIRSASQHCLVLTCLSWKRVRALLRGSTVPQAAYIEQPLNSVKRGKVRSGLGGSWLSPNPISATKQQGLECLSSFAFECLSIFAFECLSVWVVLHRWIHL